jgi:High potential iron-sulfur protein
MHEKLISRRDLLQKSAAVAGALAVLGGAAACSKQSATLVCTDTSGLAPTDLTVRTTLGYTDVSVEAGKMCTTCQQFVPAAAANTCGTCKILKGPINPKGYCKSYVAKPT